MMNDRINRKEKIFLDIVKCLMNHQQKSKISPAEGHLKLDENKQYCQYSFLLDLVRDQTTIDTNQQQDRKKIPILPVRNNITDERISFTLEKDLIDNDKEEVVYSSRSNRL